jgi:hypothetical protein
VAAASLLIEHGVRRVRLESFGGYETKAIDGL